MLKALLIWLVAGMAISQGQGLSEPESEKAVSQGLFDSKMSNYDPNNYWGPTTKQLPAGSIVVQKIYSRGNDENTRQDGTTEAGYETALMFVQLIAQKIAPTRYTMTMEVYASLSTPEISHASSVFPFRLRAGLMNTDGDYNSLSPWIVDGYERPSTFNFLDQTFLNQLKSRTARNALGQWISAKISVTTIDVAFTKMTNGAGFIQSLTGRKFSSNDESDPSVKHKINWYVKAEDNKITGMNIIMEQPKSIPQAGKESDWLNQFLKELGHFQYVNQMWSKVFLDGTRFPAK